MNLMPSVRGVLQAAFPLAATGAVVAGLAGQGAGQHIVAGAANPAGHGASAAVAATPDQTAPLADTVSYKEDVLPIFQKRCAKCHGGTDEEGEVVAEVSLIVIDYERLMMGSEFGPVVTAGDPVDSWLLEMITEGDMPPEGEGDKVPEEEITVIRQWIAEGAKNN